MFQLLLPLFALAYVASGASISAVNPEGRVAFGHKETIQNIPWIISLQVSGTSICGGFVYDSRIVITAYHCIRDYDITAYTVVAGSENPFVSGVSRKVVKISDDGWFDIAVLLLDSPLEFGPNIQPIEIIDQDVEIPAGTSALIAGWGYSVGNGYPKELWAANITMKAFQECYNALNPYREYTEIMICGVGDNGESICSGDSGGPLIVGNRVAGTVYWGVGCGSGLPSVFAKLSSCSNLIKSKVKDLLAQA